LSSFVTFSGEQSWLSNFWYQTIEYEGILYPSTEHAYQASKTLDMNVRQEMANMGNASSVMRYGRTLPVRPDWEDVKIKIMYDVNVKKFENYELRKKLLATGNQDLVEGNTWGDTFWGVCGGVGENNLGKILMRIREEIKCGDLKNPIDELMWQTELLFFSYANNEQYSEKSRTLIKLMWQDICNIQEKF